MSDDLDLGAAGPPAREQMLAVVTGLIHPTRLGWMFEQPIQYDLDRARCMVSIMHGQFNVFIEGDRPEDTKTFINVVGSIVQGCLDSLGFFLATPLRAEILSMVMDGNTLVYRKDQWLDLLPEGSGTHVEGDKLQPFTRAAIEEPLIRLALADLRAALESPDDTVMLCYRAIESVRQWFIRGSVDDDAARKQSWIDMRTNLGVERAAIGALVSLATSRRHGGASPVSEEQRREALTLARNVVEQLVAYRSSLAGSPPASFS